MTHVVRSPGGPTTVVVARGKIPSRRSEIHPRVRLPKGTDDETSEMYAPAERGCRSVEVSPRKQCNTINSAGPDGPDTASTTRRTPWGTNVSVTRKLSTAYTTVHAVGEKRTVDVRGYAYAAAAAAVEWSFLKIYCYAWSLRGPRGPASIH